MIKLINKSPKSQFKHDHHHIISFVMQLDSKLRIRTHLLDRADRALFRF